MKDYMKIGDVFGYSEVTTQKLVGDAYELVADGYGHLCVVNTSSRADLIAHAINSHDELVTDVERLRLQLRNAFMAGWEDGVNGMEFDEAEIASIEIENKFSRS